MAGSVTTASIQIEMAYKVKNNPTSAIKKIQKSLEAMGKDGEKSEKKTSKLFASLKRIATYRALRTVLKSIVSSFKEGTNNLYQWSKAMGGSFAKSMDKLTTSLTIIKNSLGLAISPLIEGVIVPLIEKVSNLIVDLTNRMSRFIAILKGQTTYTAVATDITKEYAKAQKQLLGFDELNVLSSNSTSDTSNMFKTMGVGEIGELSKVKTQFTEFVQSIKDNINTIEKIAFGASAALGLILTLSGDFIHGIPLLLAGGIGVATVSADWGIVTDDIKKTLVNITEIASTCLLAVGVLLAVFGGAALRPLALGMIVAGIGGLATAIELGNGVDDIKKGMSSLMLFLGGCALALGVILLLSGVNIGLGIGLILAGATSMGTAIAINWDSIVAKVESVCKKIADVFKTWFEKIKSWWNDLFIGNQTNADGFNFRSSEVNSEAYNDGISIDGFASGGYPTQGSLFYAGEQGAEWVGNVGGRTAVYNADQMASSLACANEIVVDAIFQAVNAINNTINNQPTPSIKIGDREIYQASIRGQRIVGNNLVQGV